MFREIRKKERELTGDRVDEILNLTDYGYLNLGTSENGYAYGIPISYAYDKETQSFYFHGANEGQKLDEMKRNSKVSFCVVGNVDTLPEKFSTKYESVLAFGKISIITEEGEKRKALRLLVLKYSPEYIEMGEKYINSSWDKNTTFKVHIEHITAKARY